VRYKLPEALGGGEYEALTDYRSKAGDDWRFRFRIPDVGLVDVPAESLTEVKPPLPPEPPVGSVVLDQNGRVWQSRAGRPGPDSVSQWQSVMGGQQPWTYVGTLKPTLLVPDPFAEPVELPWEDASTMGTPIGLKISGHDEMSLDFGHPGARFPTTGVLLNGYRARRLAAALVAAANEMEATP